jgi:intracellular sulfur oxidation DsrE/DsrF family protein
MTPTPDRVPASPLRRRGFLARVAAGAAVLATGFPAAARAERLFRPLGEDPDHWLDALTGKHRQIYDVLSPSKAGDGTAFARNFLNANNDGYGLTDAEVNVAVSFRHEAFAMGLNDTMWNKYRLGELLEYEDPNTKAPALRNTAAGSSDDTRKSSSSLAALHSRGAVFPVCGMAMAFFAGQAAKRAGADADAVRTEFRANLVPGAVEVVAGVIAVNRAQERGMSYVYVG